MIDGVAATSCVLSFGLVANAIFLLCLIQTWKTQRQTKLYLAMLFFGNCLEICFTFPNMLVQIVTGSTWLTSAACKFLAMMSILGESFSNMSLAALSVHLLLTAITGSQGTSVRHILVIGLFTLLSLPLPFATISRYDTFNIGPGEVYCIHNAASPWDQLSFDIGSSVALVFFPLVVFVCCWVAAAYLFCGERSEVVKADDDKSDFVITLSLGLTVLVCCVPFSATLLASYFIQSYGETMTAINVLIYLNYTRNTISATICTVWGYWSVYRQRNSAYRSIDSPDKPLTNDEGQRLVS